MRKESTRRSGRRAHGWILPAAGAGRRLGAGRPKALVEVLGRPLVAWTLEAVRRVHPDAPLVLVVPPGMEGEFARLAAWARPVVVPGRETRRASVRAGLAALGRLGRTEFVWVHDGCRPLLRPGLIRRLEEAARAADVVCPVLPVADTVGQQTEAGWRPVERGDLLRVQTPQVFRWDALERVLSESPTGPGRAPKPTDGVIGRSGAPHEPTDEATQAWSLGLRVTTVEGDPANLKVTWPGDVDVAASLLAGTWSGQVRMGIGFDVHRFAPGRPLRLGGVEIPSDLGLEGHSDADVLCHAVADALLGAAGLGDIGQHFPPGEPQWRDVGGLEILRAVREKLARKGWQPESVDAVVICEAPAISPHRAAMAGAMAQALGLAEECVSVKATTTEGLGALGRREGIAAQAVAVVRRGLDRRYSFVEEPEVRDG